jgi:glycosyltransferase involved in cell wall biosynthesis
MKQHVAAAGGRVDELIPLGADLSVFDHADTSAAPSRLVHIGDLNRVKDQTLLLHAFQGVLVHRPTATLDIAGHDTLGGEMARLAAALGIAAHVKFTGYLRPAELATMLRGAAAHVLSSRHDAGPVAVLEAGACAVPTVGTSVGHVADLAALPQPAAVAIAERHAEALTAAIVDLLADNDRRAALGARARAWSIAHGSRHTSHSFQALYRRLAARS